MCSVIEKDFVDEVYVADVDQPTRSKCGPLLGRYSLLTQTAMKPGFSYRLSQNEVLLMLVLGYAKIGRGVDCETRFDEIHLNHEYRVNNCLNLCDCARLMKHSDGFA